MNASAARSTRKSPMSNPRRTLALSLTALLLAAGALVLISAPAHADEAPACSEEAVDCSVLVPVPVITDPPPREVLVCEPGTVPGWLGEDGLPTSCVSNNPCPEVEAGQPCPGDPIPTEKPTAAPTAAPAPPAAFVPVEVATAPIAKNVLHSARTDGFDHQAAAPVLAETGVDPDGLRAALIFAVGGILVGAIALRRSAVRDRRLARAARR